MPRVVIDSDELYPYYFVTKTRAEQWPERAVDLTDDELTDLKRVEAEFHAWQDRLAAKIDANQRK